MCPSKTDRIKHCLFFSFHSSCPYVLYGCPMSFVYRNTYWRFVWKNMTWWFLSQIAGNAEQFFRWLYESAAHVVELLVIWGILLSMWRNSDAHCSKCVHLAVMSLCCFLVIQSNFGFGIIRICQTDSNAFEGTILSNRARWWSISIHTSRVWSICTEIFPSKVPHLYYR